MDGPAVFGANRGSRPSTDDPPHAKFPAVYSKDHILDPIILLIWISYLCTIHALHESDWVVWRICMHIRLREVHRSRISISAPFLFS